MTHPAHLYKQQQPYHRSWDNDVGEFFDYNMSRASRRFRYGDAVDPTDMTTIERMINTEHTEMHQQLSMEFEQVFTCNTKVLYTHVTTDDNGRESKKLLSHHRESADTADFVKIFSSIVNTKRFIEICFNEQKNYDSIALLYDGVYPDHDHDLMEDGAVIKVVCMNRDQIAHLLMLFMNNRFTDLERSCPGIRPLGFWIRKTFLKLMDDGYEVRIIIPRAPALGGYLQAVECNKLPAVELDRQNNNEIWSFLRNVAENAGLAWSWNELVEYAVGIATTDADRHIAVSLRHLEYTDMCRYANYQPLPNEVSARKTYDERLQYIKQYTSPMIQGNYLTTKPKYNIAYIKKYRPDFRVLDWASIDRMFMDRRDPHTGQLAPTMIAFQASHDVHRRTTSDMQSILARLAKDKTMRASAVRTSIESKLLRDEHATVMTASAASSTPPSRIRPSGIIVDGDRTPVSSSLQRLSTPEPLSRSVTPRSQTASPRWESPGATKLRQLEDSQLGRMSRSGSSDSLVDHLAKHMKVKSLSDTVLLAEIRNVSVHPITIIRPVIDLSTVKQAYLDSIPNKLTMLIKELSDAGASLSDMIKSKSGDLYNYCCRGHASDYIGYLLYGSRNKLPRKADIKYLNYMVHYMTSLMPISQRLSNDVRNGIQLFQQYCRQRFIDLMRSPLSTQLQMFVIPDDDHEDTVAAHALLGGYAAVFIASGWTDVMTTPDMVTYITDMCTSVLELQTFENAVAFHATLLEGITMQALADDLLPAVFAPARAVYKKLKLNTREHADNTTGDDQIFKKDILISKFKTMLARLLGCIIWRAHVTSNTSTVHSVAMYIFGMVGTDVLNCILDIIVFFGDIVTTEITHAVTDYITNNIDNASSAIISEKKTHIRRTGERYLQFITTCIDPLIDGIHDAAVHQQSNRSANLSDLAHELETLKNTTCDPERINQLTQRISAVNADIAMLIIKQSYCVSDPVREAMTRLKSQCTHKLHYVAPHKPTHGESTNKHMSPEQKFEDSIYNRIYKFRSAPTPSTPSTPATPVHGISPHMQERLNGLRSPRARVRTSSSSFILPQSAFCTPLPAHSDDDERRFNFTPTPTSTSTSSRNLTPRGSWAPQFTYADAPVNESSTLTATAPDIDVVQRKRQQIFDQLNASRFTTDAAPAPVSSRHTDTATPLLSSRMRTIRKAPQ